MRKNGFGKRYPWETWLNGSSHVVKRDIHYSCSDRTLANCLYRMARLRGVKVSVSQPKDGVLKIQAHNGELDFRSKS